MTTAQPSSTQHPPVKTQDTGIPWMRIMLWAAVIFTVVFSLAPVLWQVLTSIKTNEAITADSVVYFPSLSQLTLDHYIDLFRRNQFYIYIFNSAFVAIISTVLCLALGSPAAYALARLKIPGERIVLTCVLVVTLFPYILLFLGLIFVWGK